MEEPNSFNNQKLNIIYLEDNPYDAELVGLLLKKELMMSFELRRVETREEFLNARETFFPDIILSDVHIPLYSGFEALEDAKRVYPHIPFILITGALAEETVADSIKSGAWDYVVKDRLKRLSSAVKNSLILKAEKDRHAETLNKLKISEERYNLALQGAHDAIWDLDLGTSKQYFSARWNEIRGFEASSIIMDHKDFIDLIHPEDREAALQSFENHLTRKTESFKSEFRITTKDGSHRWILSRGKALFDENGKPYRMSGSHTDITEEKNTDIQLRRLSQAIHHAPVSVIMTDRDGIIEYVNPEFTRSAGYSAEEVLGKNSRILKSGNHDEAFYKHMWDVLNSGAEWKGVFRNKKKNGALFWEQASISSIADKDQKISHYIAIKEDITLRVAFEEELVEAKNRAEESDRLKSSFLANMSHEIRTPMNGIIGFADLMIRRDISEDKKTYYANIIKSSSHRLLRLLTDIIDYSKIDSGLIEIHPVPLNLNMVIEQVISEAKLNNQPSNFSILEIVSECGLGYEDALFVSDEIRLKQILMNLLQNAIKFTPKGRIEVGYQKPGSDGITFYVKDTGIGIEKDKQSVIFERFRQGDESSRRSFDGVGLGLSITLGLVNALGGSIRLESKKDKGSTFFVTLPMQHLKNKIITKDFSTKESPRGIYQLKFLIVEDDPFNQKLLMEFFDDFGYDAAYAHTGEEAIELFKKNPGFDLVLMDMKLPGMNGIEATREIRKLNPDVRVIAQTAHAMSNDKEAFLKQGCNDYIEKPYLASDLKQVILSCLSKEC